MRKHDALRRSARALCSLLLNPAQPTQAAACLPTAAAAAAAPGTGAAHAALRGAHAAATQPPPLPGSAASGSSPAASLRPTIFALSSAPGRSAVAIVRISGPDADTALRCLLPVGRPLPAPRTAALVSLLTPSGGMLDRALVLRFPGPRSFTGAMRCGGWLDGGTAVRLAQLAGLIWGSHSAVL